MSQNEQPDLMRIRGFRIIADAAGKYQPIDAITQFEYKGYVISISTAGLSVGACATEVAVFEGGLEKQWALLSTVEEAISWVDENPSATARSNVSTECELGDNFQRKLLDAAKTRNDIYAVRLLVQAIEGILASVEIEEQSVYTLLNTIKNARHFNEDYGFGGFGDSSFNAARRLEVQVHKLSDYFIQLEMLLANLGEGI